VIEKGRVVQGYPPLPPRPGGRRPRNGLGAVTFVVVLLGALLAVFPATAPFGFLLCALAIVPAIMAYRRTRKGTATNRRRSLAAVALAPAFVVVAVAVSPAVAPSTIGGVDVAAREQPDRAPLSATSSAAPASTTAATATATATPVAVAAHGNARARAAGSAPVAAAPTARPDRTPGAQPARVATPKPAPKPAAKPAPGCDEATHYVNANGNCVLRPVAAASAPAGASAQCADGTYSSSQHRRGTCSSHGGVRRWLKDLPA
jgi:uncharacterized protein DUF3761